MKRPFIRGAQGTFPLDKDFQHKPEGVKESLGGDGLHEWVITHMPPTDENTEKAVSWFSSEDDFWNDIERVLEHCDNTMLALGWDRKAGNGRDFPGDRNAEPYSMLWYAGKIGLECWLLLKKREQTSHNVWTLREVLKLGMLLAEADWRLTYRPDILTGRKQRKTLKECRQRANAASKQAAEARRDAIRIILSETKLTGGALEKHLNRRLQAELGISVSDRTIRDDLKKVRSE